jgi:hypothetical protein
MERTISVHNMFSPCSAKIRASDKDLPVPISLWSFKLEDPKLVGFLPS